MSKEKIKIYLLVFLIVALGFFLRIYNINNAPPGIFPDEAMNGEDAIKAFTSGNYELFYTNNEGREGLFMNIIALCFKFFGISILTLKLPAIIFSTLTILGIYLLAKELFFQYLTKERAHQLALISAFLLTVSFWSINFGRIAFRANMLPVILVFSFYFLFYGLRTKKWWLFAISGILLGLGMHTYISWRVAPLILITLLPIFVLTRKNFLREYWKNILIFTFFSILIAYPILDLIYMHPSYLHAPIDDISVFSPIVNHGHPYLTLLWSFFLSLTKYNLVGDMNWRHNFPPYPLLDVLTGLAFLFGFIYSLKKFIHLLWLRIYRKTFKPELEIYAFLISGFFIMLIPEFFSFEGNPHALRSIGTLPFVFIFAGLAFEYLFNSAKKAPYFNQKLIQTALIFALLFIGIFNPIKYFYFWAKKPIVAESFNKNLTDISRYLKTLPANQEKFVVNSFGPYHSPLDRLPIQIFNLDTPNTTFLYSWQNFDQIKPKTKNFIIVLTGKDTDTEDRLKVVFPNLTLQKIETGLNSAFYILKPAQSNAATR